LHFELNRLYYTDPSCRSFEAIVTGVTEHERRAAVVLDRTAFYPTSGGQPFDTGRLGDVEVLETVDVDGTVVHVVSQTIPEGTSVRGEVDWMRRFDHMQQHTGQHVLSAAFDRLFANGTIGFHMGGEASSIDLERVATAEEIERAVDAANVVVWENRPVSIRFVSQDEAARLQLRKEPVREGPLRLIEIDGFDLSACGGTHVGSTAAIGMIAVVGSERLRGGMRLTFVCGRRALQALRLHRDAVAGSVRVLSVLPAELPAAIERLQAELKEQRKTIGRHQEALAVHEAVRMLAAARDTGTLRIVEVLEGWDAAGLKAIASVMTAQAPVAVALLSAAPPVVAVIARSTGVAVDSAAVLKELLQRFGGRGGGKPDLAQAGGLTGSVDAMCAAARQLLGDQS
jgi:alanyl-tRNA synthetase